MSISAPPLGVLRAGVAPARPRRPRRCHRDRALRRRAGAAYQGRQAAGIAARLSPPLPHSLAPPGASSCASSGRLWAARRHSQGGEGATALAARASCFRSRRFHRLWTAAFWSTQASVQIHSLSELLSSIDVELRRALVKRPPPQEPPPQHVPLWEAQPVPPGSVPRSPRTPH